MAKENEYFSKALSDFTYDVAGGDSIRHLADLGYTVKQIGSLLSFPMPKERIAAVVWKRYIEKGIICLEKPSDETYAEQVNYVKETSEFGRVSFRRVTEKIELPRREYIECDFGKRKYQNPDGYEKWLDTLNSKDREYIEYLPWPLKNVYHVADDRIKRITDINGEDKNI